ncbi:4'-phosphopantetheinyl transferase family protein [Fodinibius sediminis]|nr:4'-phosphopantetheinyl transferase superfamily protein [Fodinibius sediminis]
MIQRLPFEAAFSLVGITSISEEDLEQLDDQEQRALDMCKSTKRRQELVSSRLALKQLYRERGAGQSFSIRKDELGQPFGIGREQEYYVSIAHTDTRVFCGISGEEPIGVDIEPIGRAVPQKLSDRIMHPGEDGLRDVLPMIRLWTIKEAYIKLRGEGLRLNMNRVHIEQETAQTFIEKNHYKRAKICSFQHQEHWLAIAFYSK